MTRPNGSSHSIGKSSASAPARRSRFVAADLADGPDPVAVEPGIDRRADVGDVVRVDLAGEDQPPAGPRAASIARSAPLAGLNRPRNRR